MMSSRKATWRAGRLTTALFNKTELHPIMSTNKDLHDKLGDDMAWEKRQARRQDDLDAIEAAGALDDDLADEEDEQEAEDDHGIAPELQLTDSDVDELARRDALNKPAFFGFAEACAILGHPLPRPDLAEARQTAGVRCKDLR